MVCLTAVQTYCWSFDPLNLDDHSKANMSEEMRKKRALARRLLTLVVKRLESLLEDPTSVTNIKFTLNEMELQFQKFSNVEEEAFIAGIDVSDEEYQVYLNKYLDAKSKATDLVESYEVPKLNTSRKTSIVSSRTTMSSKSSESVPLPAVSVLGVNSNRVNDDFVPLEQNQSIVVNDLIDQNELSHFSAPLEQEILNEAPGLIISPLVHVSTAQECLNRTAHESITHLNQKALTTSNIQRHTNTSRINQNNNDIYNRMYPTVHTSNETSQIMLGSTLPILHLPKFSGGYTEWVSFRDLFISVIDKDVRLSNVHKLHYLKTSLEGEAASLVCSITTTDQNYRLVWDRLCAQYDCQGFIVDSYVINLLAMKNLGNKTCELGKQLDKFEEILGSLDAIGGYAQCRDPWIIRIILDRIDDDSRRLWANKSADLTAPSLDYFRSFLLKRRRALQRMNTHSDNSKPSTSDQKADSERSKVSNIKGRNVLKSSAATTTKNCPLCSESHRLYQCEKFKSMSVKDRRSKASELSVCFNCLIPGHITKNCNSDKRCLTCKLHHHTFLHIEKQGDSSLSSNVAVPVSYKGLLATAVVLVESARGFKLPCRVLLDNGSQVSFISDRCVKRLSLLRHKANIFVTGISGSKGGNSKGIVALKLSSRFDPTNELNMDAFVLNKVTSDLPGDGFIFEDIDHIKGYNLADPDFNRTSSVDILIGIDTYFAILKGEPIKFNSGFWFQNTLFGWVIAGGKSIPKSPSNVNLSSLSSMADLDKGLEKFWLTEEFVNDDYSAEEITCEEHFQNTFSRLKDGKYQVRLPFRPNVTDLGHSESLAVKRLYQLENRFRKDPKFHQKYNEFMNLYLSNGFMEAIPNDKIQSSKNVCYLTHHGVMQKSPSGMKIRVVFNGSAKTSSGLSLNDVLYTGGNLQLNIVEILLNFRIFPFVLSTDIEKMFLHISLNKKDRDYQRVLWRFKPTDKITHYRMTTVTFGEVCSPFLAMRVLRQLAADESERFPIAANILTSSIYMDDILAGAFSLSELKEVKSQLIGIMSTAGFSLKKWTSNDKSILNDLGPSDFAVDPTLMFKESKSIKTLGIYWNMKNDSFAFSVSLDADPKFTKRCMLSESSRLYDPCGWLSPTIILMKQLFQALWSSKIGWEDPLPSDVLYKWKTVRNELPLLESARIPRWLSLKKYSSFELHGFSDASEKAFGAVIYLKHVNECGTFSIHLLISKTRVSPLKKITIPRLELNAALLLSKLMHFSLKCFSNFKVKCFFWCDSQVVLAWLKKNPSTLKSYVSNRISQIQEMFPSAEWRYVPTYNNPADITSRGMTPKTLINCEYWWNGPEWLKTIKIPEFTQKLNYDNLPEMKNERLKANVSDITELSLVKKYSDFDKLLRITSYCFRFVKLCKREIVSTNFSPQEIEFSLHRLIMMEQKRLYFETVKRLNENKKLKCTDTLLPLDPFLDGENLLRVGGRINNSNLSFDSKHPIILPSKSYLCELIIRREHRSSCHSGLSTTLANIRQKFWIPKARSVIRKELHKCIRCFKHRPRHNTQLMGQLPNPRVTPSKTFANVGIDYAGPFYIRPTKRRGNLTIKVFIAIFICLSTKAVHIEYVSDLTTEACLAAISRFICRRGRPKVIMSDNGTNFIGSRKFLDATMSILLEEGFNKSIANSLAIDRIEWKFIPPRAPEFGGLWESAVKSAKSCFFKAAGNERLSLEEFITLLNQVECSLNSRPLCYITGDEDDYEILTPGHFIIGSHMKGLPELEVNGKISLKSRWLHIQNIHLHFWTRWSREYLVTLNSRSKNLKRKINIEEGQIGILVEETKPNKWSLAKVISAIKGPDGLVRVIDVKTKGGLKLRRPVNKFCPLPFNDFVSELNSETAGEDV